MKTTGHSNPPFLTLLAALSVGLGPLIFPGSLARAGDRKFAYTYEATTMPKGSLEFENWVTWKSYGDGDRFDFRHEIEYGVTDDFQIALYFANWRYEDRGGKSDSTFKSTSIEAIYAMTNPTEDILGSALYLEAGIGEEELFVEGKLLLQKNFGRWIVAGNSIIESEWEGEDLDNLTEVKGELAQTLGISYQFCPSFSAGFEGLMEIEIKDWQDSGDLAVYLGPNLSWRKGSFFVTVAALWQATNFAGEPEVQTRALAGFHF